MESEGWDYLLHYLRELYDVGRGANFAATCRQLKDYVDAFYDGHPAPVRRQLLVNALHALNLPEPELRAILRELGLAHLAPSPRD